MKNRPAISVFIILLLAFPFISFALPNDVSAICGDNNTLTFSISSVRCINNVCKVIQNNSTVVCQYGCDDNSAQNNECNPAPSQVNVLFYFGAVIFLIFLLGVYKYLKSR